jgi:phospholipid/cholesterol/gamma-HCH transport system substrate-binding protein
MERDIAMTPRKRNIITGAVVLGALGVLAWMILSFSGQAMGIFKAKGVPVVFLADRADGLYEGSPVFFKGVSIGRVTGLERLKDNETVRIEGDVQNTPPLPANLIGDIKASSSLGTSTQIDIRLDGKPKGQLQPHQEIKVRYTGGSLLPPEFTDMVEQANKQQLVQHVDQMIVSLKAQVEKAGKVMDSADGWLADPKLKTDMRVAIANVREASERANKIAANLDKLTDNANATMSDVRTTLAKTDKNLETLTHQVGDDLDKIGRNFQEIQQIADKINHGKGTAGALINDPRLYDELSATAKQLNVVSASLARLIDQWEHEGVALKLSK